LNCASLPGSNWRSIFGLAEDESPLFHCSYYACSTGDETPIATELRIVLPRQRMSFRLPSNLLSRNSRREAEFPISIEPFHLPAGQEMFFPIPYWATN
jgi:hypothetical protein